jgi:hypothetical protein
VHALDSNLLVSARMSALDCHERRRDTQLICDQSPDSVVGAAIRRCDLNAQAQDARIIDGVDRV